MNYTQLGFATSLAHAQKQVAKNKFTPMQQFALDFMGSQEKSINANQLAYAWALSKNKARSASRDMFGFTSNAYQTLRKLAKNNVINVVHTKHGSYLDESFSLK